MAKRKNRFIRPVIISLLVLVSASIIVYYLSSQYYKPSFIRYPAFGIDLPINFSIHGIDVSRHQQTIGWPVVKEMKASDVSIGFVFIKATEGLGRVDEQFRRNWNEAGKANIAKGAYHFFIATKSGKAQAENFIETVQLKKGDLPPVLDIEQTYGASITDLQQRAADWLMMVEKKYKVKPIIYTNVDFYNNFLAGRFDDYPLWVAHYLVKDKPRIQRSWSFWQHNERGHVSGIRSFVDFNVFNGDSLAFEKMKIGY